MIKEWLCAPDMQLLSGYVLHGDNIYNVSVAVSIAGSDPDVFTGIIHKENFIGNPCPGWTCAISGELKNKTGKTIPCEIEFMPKSVVYSSFGIDSDKYKWSDNFCFTKIKCITIHCPQ